ncbi:MAG: hypothetical protein J4F28_09515 [Nitrosopumilaceae archaeon]|nr:hypothetical protein [Nitrosopumilaceae archaeon]
MRDDFTSVSLNRALVIQIRRVLLTVGAQENGLTSVAKFVELAIREKLGDIEIKRFSHVSTLDDGIRILDNWMKPIGSIVTVSFKDEWAWCDHCEDMSCVHVQYAWAIPEIRKVLEERGLRQSGAKRSNT